MDRLCGGIPLREVFLGVIAIATAKVAWVAEV